MRLVRQHLCVSDFGQLKKFYTEALGMTFFGDEDHPLFGYDKEQCLLGFSRNPNTSFESGDNDFYWKTGITVSNLDHAVRHLHSLDYPVSEPRQFRDIGFLCHLVDPYGLRIELLQQGFEGNEKPVGSGHPVGSQAIIAHITLRVTDIIRAKAFFETRLGMRLMSVQPVPERSFTLYFYAWSDEDLPNPDLTSPKNREWLWARPYTLIELKHMQLGSDLVDWPDPETSRFSGFSWGTPGSTAPATLGIRELVTGLK